MKLLITGVHGFVGSNLVQALRKDHTIYGLDIVAPEKEGVEKSFSWDDLGAGRIPEIDAIIHLAGKAHDTKNQAAADVYFKVNTGLTQKAYDYFPSLNTGAAKVVVDVEEYPVDIAYDYFVNACQGKVNASDFGSGEHFNRFHA